MAQALQNKFKGDNFTTQVLPSSEFFSFKTQV